MLLLNICNFNVFLGTKNYNNNYEIVSFSLLRQSCYHPNISQIQASSLKEI